MYDDLFFFKRRDTDELTVTSENKDYTIAVSGRIDTLTAPAL